jgi:hypothetical protein
MLILALPAFAQDDEPGLAEISYNGSMRGNAPNYVKGKPVSVSHSGGNIQVRCMNVDKLSAVVQYTVYGTQEGPMESMGNGYGVAVYGDSKVGSVKTRVPSKPSGVTRAEADLTVNIPAGIAGLTVTQSGKGWVQVLGCSGIVKIGAGAGGAYAEGAWTGGAITAAGGDVKLELSKDAILKSATSVSAPGGNATLLISPAQGGTLKAAGAEVAVSQTVMGTNSATLVQGSMGVAGPAISVTAPRGKAEVVNNN